MPRVKIDYVVSFSSEDPENQASNLLALEVSKKKWLCSKGEPSCSVVLQLTKAVKISAIHVGVQHAALVEVLVGRSEKPNEPFEVLVPSSVFVSPAESRRDIGTERVRSFSDEQLARPAREQRWDRVRAVCSQPYNKHCQYGLSFIHIYEPEPPSSSVGSSTAPPSQSSTSGPPVMPPEHTCSTNSSSAIPSRLLNLDTYSTDEDDFRPGELFAKHLHKTETQGKTGNTDAQIRQATSQALKNIPGSETKLTNTPISKPSCHQIQTSEDAGHSRQRNNLMYDNDDDKPHAKIDRVVQKHRDEKSRELVSKGNQASKEHEKNIEKLNTSVTKQDANKRYDNSHRHEGNRPIASSSKNNTQSEERTKYTSQSSTNDRGERSSLKRDQDSRKQRDSDKTQGKDGDRLKAGPKSSTPHTLLRDVVFVLSGYENPRRAQLRNTALALGARCERDWGPDCTHLICAFPNTPKLRQVRAARGGAHAHAVRGEWVEQTSALCRRLPEQWFATEPARSVPPPPHMDEDDSVSECDTDDEIEKVLRKQKKQRVESPPSDNSRENTIPDKPMNDSIVETDVSKHNADSKDMANISGDSDVAFVRDERIQGSVTINSDSDDTDVEYTSRCDKEEKIEFNKALPDFFDGYTFMVEEEDALLQRYIRAYGGALLRPADLDEETEVDYMVCARAPHSSVRGRARVCVRAAWVWCCHKHRRLCDVDQYKLT